MLITVCNVEMLILGIFIGDTLIYNLFEKWTEIFMKRAFFLFIENVKRVLMKH